MTFSQALSHAKSKEGVRELEDSFLLPCELKFIP